MQISTNEVFADVHLAWVYQQGFRRVFMSVGYLAEKIQAHCGDGSKWGLSITYFSDGDSPLGTAGALSLTLSQEFEHVAITYGDTLLKLDCHSLIQKLLNHPKSSLPPKGLMTVYKNQLPQHLCNADIQGEFVTYSKGNPKSGWLFIDYGFLILERSVLSKIDRVRPLDLAVVLEKLSLEKKLLGFVAEDRFWEIGTQQALDDFRMQKPHSQETKK